MLWGFIPLLRIMNPGFCTMSLFADYVKFCAKVKGQGMTLTFDDHVASFTHLVDCKYKLKFTGNNSFQNINNFHFFPYKSICDQI